MDSMIASLTEDTKSIHLDIAGFQSQVTALEQWLMTVETQAALIPNRDQELWYLRSKVIDLEGRSSRDNICFLGFPENIEGADVQSVLKTTLPQIIGLTFDSPLEFQRAHRLGPKPRNGDNHPRPIIACFLRHTQALQLLQKARMQGPFCMNEHQIRMTADFSKETSEHRKAFLALQPCLRQPEVKFDLFELARMWIMKNNVSKDFYDPMDLSLYLNSLSDRPMDTATLLLPQTLTTTAQNPLPTDRSPSVALNKSRYLERLSKNHNDKRQVLHALAKHTQVADRDKSRSPLKPPAAPT
ncbi:hypothetical protein NDU88_005523 [Pleurodeles waltl]|uniref:Uncharacterized protein n=1 Tax=Pleurodeles waltl TaxID=8319 RepID=A0AAV7SLW3_PLEWA|nr:hypothetical protein NDU88_005523 [Pleurodeles waltl]